MSGSHSQFSTLHSPLISIPSGYKQTEVGVIPKEWEVKHLGDLGDVVRGGSPGPAGDPRYFNGNFIPWLTVAALTNISEHQLTVSQTLGGLTEEGSRLSRTLPEGTFIIANSGATLGVAKLLGVTCCANDGIAAIINQRLGDKPFVCHFVNTQTKRLREVIASGNGQPNLNTGLIREIPIPFPPLPEQRAIAEALSDVDGLLGGLDRLIAKKRDLKQATMQQLLTGQTRLPGFHGEWEVKAICDQIDLLTGFPFPSNQYSEAGVRLLRGSNVKRGETDWAEDLVQYWWSITLDIERYQLQPSDLAIAMDGSLVGRSYARLTPTDLPALLLQRVARIRSKNIDIGFLTQVVGSERFTKYCDSVKTVTAIPHISSADIRNFEMSLPLTIDEQTAIAEVLTEMDAELARLEQRREKTRALKQAMMQELLTGRTRLV